MLRLDYRKQKILIIFTFSFIPLLLLGVFSYYPALSLFHISFTKWNGLDPVKTWVGLDNYRQVFSDPQIFGVFRHNLAYLIGSILQNIIALLLAIVLNGKLRGRNLFRVIIFLPFIMNNVATAYMFSFVYDFQDGSLNTLLRAVGLEALASRWLGDVNLVNYSLAAVSVWKYTGFTMVIYLGALQSIPSELYEAARIDGANAPQLLRYITLPGIIKIIELNLFLTVSGALEVFELPFIMTGGGPGDASSTFVTKTVDTAFVFDNYGLASAMGVVLLILTVIVLGAQRLVLGRRE